MLLRILIAYLTALAAMVCTALVLGAAAHWVDGQSLEVIIGTARRASSNPVIMVVLAAVLGVLTVFILFIGGGGKRDPLADDKPQIDHWLR